jgi:hypothetical protein
LPLIGSMLAQQAGQELEQGREYTRASALIDFDRSSIDINASSEGCP